MGAVLEPQTLPDEHLAILSATVSRTKKARRRRNKYHRPTTYVTREQQVRRLLQTLTRCEWPNKRPEFLRVGKRCLELDCWCPRLSAAFEVNGAHHHTRIAHWQTEREFQQQQSNDMKKRRICEMLGILLVTVPPRSVVGDCDLPRFVLEQLSKHKVLSRQPFRLL